MEQKEKFKVFPFDWKPAWKHFEKYIKKHLNGFPGVSQRRQQVLAYVKRTLNNNKIKAITKEKIAEVENIFQKESRDNKFYQQAGKYFVNFLNDMLS